MATFRGADQPQTSIVTVDGVTSIIDVERVVTVESFPAKAEPLFFAPATIPGQLDMGAEA